MKSGDHVTTQKVDRLEMGAAQGRGFDLPLFGATLLLGAFGLVMVYSASAVYAMDRFGSDNHFVLRQGIYLATGLAALLFGLNMDYRSLERWARPMLLVAIFLLIAVLIPGLGVKVGGARRWFRMGPLSVQPSEVAKVAVVIYMAALLANRERRITSLFSGFVAPLLVVGLLTALTLLQPDLGTAVLLGLSALLVMFVAGTRLTYILVAAMVAAPPVWFAIVGTPWRLKRLMAFFDPEAHREGAGYQVWEALLTLGSGGLTGLGLGEGQQKLFYLPEAHTDFILAVVGQELGFIGVSAVLVAFGVILWRATRVALRCPDRFGAYLAFGFTGVIGFQACIAMAVVVGILPTKGITLPFVSYGGSSLIASFFMVGVILGVSRGPLPATEPAPAAGQRRSSMSAADRSAPALVGGPAPARTGSGGIWRAFRTRGPMAHSRHGKSTVGPGSKEGTCVS